MLQTYTFFAFTCVTLAANNNNSNSEFESRFVREPSGRGTVGVLWSCIFTLGLCVWTAVHGDITANPTTLRRALYKIVWMVLALLGPEIVVAYALRQLLQAWEVRQKCYEKWRVIPGSKEDRFGWEGAFFVVMGGYVTDYEGQGLRTLTPEGFIYFTEIGDISHEDVDRKIINDKGKASGIQKLIVVLQTLWMIIQVAARKVNGLPVPLLEIHVVIHVLFAITVYSLWWYKPMDISLPIQISITLPKNKNPLAKPSELFTEPIKAGIILEWPRTFWNILLQVTTLDNPKPLMSVLAMCLLNGGLHATAWNYKFSTNLERLLWRISCTIVALGPLVQTSFLALLRYNKKTREWYKNVSSFDRPAYQSWTIMFFQILWYGLYYLTYAFGICYIMIEPFVSMRDVPMGSYQTVEWLDFWHHI